MDSLFTEQANILSLVIIYSGADAYHHLMCVNRFTRRVVMALCVTKIGTDEYSEHVLKLYPDIKHGIASYGTIFCRVITYCLGEMHGAFTAQIHGYTLTGYMYKGAPKRLLARGNNDAIYELTYKAGQLEGCAPVDIINASNYMLARLQPPRRRLIFG